MSKLNRDVLYLIFEELELQEGKKALYSCLSVNKIWCEIIVPILWNNPWKSFNQGALLNVIISHLSEESRNYLKFQGVKFLTNSFRKPLFDYISLCKHLNLCEIKNIINATRESAIPAIENEVYNLFVNNKNTKFTHLYIPRYFNHKILQGVSEIEFLSCYTSINDNILVELTEKCRSIKELKLGIEKEWINNYELIRLIETQKRLLKIHLSPADGSFYPSYDLLFIKSLENSFIKHANTIESCELNRQPVTTFVSTLVNLKRLRLDNYSSDNKWNWLEKLSLPFLKILSVSSIQIKSLISLIENTSGYLTEIKIDYILHNEIDNKRIVQAIYQNCPDLKYLKLAFRNRNILELENLLINCQHLSLLYILVNDASNFDWDNLFKILAESSPTSLFKFRFGLHYTTAKLETLKLFFDNWKGRRPILLQFSHYYVVNGLHDDLLEKYEAKGIVKLCELKF